MAMGSLPLSISLLYDHRTKRNIKKNEQTTRANIRLNLKGEDL